jgi:hypothetical protein
MDGICVRAEDTSAPRFVGKKPAVRPIRRAFAYVDTQLLPPWANTVMIESAAAR